MCAPSLAGDKRNENTKVFGGGQNTSANVSKAIDDLSDMRAQTKAKCLSKLTRTTIPAIGNFATFFCRFCREIIRR
jgi:hypothetical protein